jgi:hypothetical protein
MPLCVPHAYVCAYVCMYVVLLCLTRFVGIPHTCIWIWIRTCKICEYDLQTQWSAIFVPFWTCIYIYIYIYIHAYMHCDAHAYTTNTYTHTLSWYVFTPSMVCNFWPRLNIMNNGFDLSLNSCAYSCMYVCVCIYGLLLLVFLCMCLWMYVSVCVYIFDPFWTSWNIALTYPWIPACIHACMCVYMYVCMCRYFWSLSDIMNVGFERTFMHACMHVCIYVRVCVQLYVSMYMYVLLKPFWHHECWLWENIHACMCVCMYVRACVCVYLYLYLYMYAYVCLKPFWHHECWLWEKNWCMQACVYAFMYTCVCVRVCIGIEVYVYMYVFLEPSRHHEYWFESTFMHVREGVCACVNVNMGKKIENSCASPMCNYACMYVCTYAQIHGPERHYVYVCIYVRLYVSWVARSACMHICKHACMQARIYVWMHPCFMGESACVCMYSPREIELFIRALTLQVCGSIRSRPHVRVQNVPIFIPLACVRPKTRSNKAWL